jgi:hypothetical protein
MSKYQKLASHLNSLKTERWTATFEEIQTILGFELPNSARSYPAWWSNQAGEGHSQKVSWQSVGWRTSELDLEREQISFVREAGRDAPQREVRTKVERKSIHGLSIAEAKAALASYYDVALDNVEITIRG